MTEGREAAATARLQGVLILVPLLLEELSKRERSSAQLGPMMAIPAGTLVYFAYLWGLTGEPFAYFVAQRGWHNEIVGLWHHPWRWVTGGLSEPAHLLEIGIVAFMIAILVIGYRRLRRSYWIYSLVYLLLLLSSSYLLGLPRYCAALFPLYLVLGDLAERHPDWGRALIAVFAASSPVVFWVWTRWAYAF